MKIGRTAVATDTGRRRLRNEDAYVFQTPFFAIADEAPIRQQVCVGEEDPVQPLGLDQRAPRGHVVDESLLRIYQSDIGDVVESLGGVDAAIAATDDEDGGGCA